MSELRVGGTTTSIYGNNDGIVAVPPLMSRVENVSVRFDEIPSEYA